MTAPDVWREATTFRVQMLAAPSDAVRRIKAVLEATGLGLYEACDALHRAGWDVDAAILATAVTP